MRYCSRCRTSYADERFCPLDGGVVVDAKEAADPLIGQTLGGRYLLHARLGQGGMGAVYEAEHTGLGKRVAVKLLLDQYSEDREVLARFHQEARTASRIGHENIIDILDIGEHEGRSFIVMELLQGHDLRRVCRDVGALPVERAVPVIKQIARALGAAHAKDVIHRDMKPENVFLTERSGFPDFVKIMDFGISKIKAAHDSQVRLTQTGAVIGTPLYMAPEQALGRTDIDHRADIYSVGVMMFELVCGRPPFEAPTYLALMAQHLNEQPPPPRRVRPDLPPALDAAILRALEKEPAQRFQSMAELSAALPRVAPVATPNTVFSGSGALTPPPMIATGTPAAPGAGAAPSVWCAPAAPRSKAGLIVVVALALAAAAAGVVFGVTRGDDEDDASAAQEPAGDPAPAPSPGGPAVSAVAPIGSLEVQSDPPGAKVFLDGKERGTTRLLLEEVPAGRHTLRLELEGYTAVETEKVVRAGLAETFHTTLAPVRRGMVVSKPPPEATPPVQKPPVQKPPTEKPPTPADPPKSVGDGTARPPVKKPPTPGGADDDDDDGGRKKNPYLDNP